MKRKKIRCEETDNTNAKRFCDAILDDNGNIYLEKKTGKEIETIELNEFLRQVNLLKEQKA